jgi:hypothetical protein
MICVSSLSILVKRTICKISKSHIGERRVLILKSCKWYGWQENSGWKMVREGPRETLGKSLGLFPPGQTQREQML